MLYNAGDCHGVLSLLNEDDLSNVNKMRIKVLSRYLSGHVDVSCPVDGKKKHLSSQKLLALMQWKAVTKAI